MKNQFLSVVTILFVTGASFAADPPAGSEVFGLTKMHSVHLSVSAKAYSAMEPPPNANPFGPPGGAARPPGLNPADAGAGNFGFEFTYVHADARVDGQSLSDIGLRYKGSGSYLASSRNAKRSFKIEFDRYTTKQAFHGVSKLNLNNGVMDATKAREALAYSVFRSAGVPACRTAFAEVTLTVPGKFENEYLGVYTIVEQVDKSFLKSHFKNSKGLLLKPEGIRGIPFLGDDPAAYAKPFNVKSSDDPSGIQRLIALTKLINKSDDTQFRVEIGNYLDVESFSRFLAANVVLASLDGFLGMGHNYYLYLSPDTNKFTFIPWDLDLAFGGFFLFGQPDQLANLSVEKPFEGSNKLIERLLNMPEFKKTYLAHVKRLAETVLTPASLGKEIEAIEALTKNARVKEQKAAEARKEGGGGFGMPGMGGPPQSLKSWIEKRAASVTMQLAGKTKGHVPTMATFGPPGGFGPPPGGFGAGNQLAKPLFELLDSNKDGKVSEEEFLSGMQRLFKEWDKDKNGTLDQKKIAEGLQKLIPPPPGGPFRP